jgi:hypothetical protein
MQSSLEVPGMSLDIPDQFDLASAQNLHQNSLILQQEGSYSKLPV